MSYTTLFFLCFCCFSENFLSKKYTANGLPNLQYYQLLIFINNFFGLISTSNNVNKQKICGREANWCIAISKVRKVLKYFSFSFMKRNTVESYHIWNFGCGMTLLYKTLLLIKKSWFYFKKTISGNYAGSLKTFLEVQNRF